MNNKKKKEGKKKANVISVVSIIITWYYIARLKEMKMSRWIRMKNLKCKLFYMRYFVHCMAAAFTLQELGMIYTNIYTCTR